MSGLELQRELAESGHRFPIVFVTAHANDAAEAQAMQAGASDFLRKPVSEHALIHAIEVALRPILQDGAECCNSGINKLLKPMRVDCQTSQPANQITRL